MRRRIVCHPSFSLDAEKQTQVEATGLELDQDYLMNLDEIAIFNSIFQNKWDWRIDIKLDSESGKSLYLTPEFPDGVTLLTYAILEGRVPAIQKILEATQDTRFILQKNLKGETALDFLRYSPFPSVRPFLSQLNDTSVAERERQRQLEAERAEIERQRQLAAAEAAERMACELTAATIKLKEHCSAGDLNSVVTLMRNYIFVLKEVMSADASSAFKKTLLMTAVQSPNNILLLRALIQQLIETGDWVTLNAQLSDGRSAFFIACSVFGSEAAALEFFQCLPSSDGEASLGSVSGVEADVVAPGVMQTSRRQHWVKYLSFFEACNDSGVNPLMMAAANGYAKVVKLFLERAYFYDIDAAVGSDGPSALRLALEAGHLEIVAALMLAGANLRDVDQYLDFSGQRFQALLHNPGTQSAAAFLVAWHTVSCSEKIKMANGKELSSVDRFDPSRFSMEVAESCSAGTESGTTSTASFFATPHQIRFFQTANLLPFFIKKLAIQLVSNAGLIDCRVGYSTDRSLGILCFLVRFSNSEVASALAAAAAGNATAIDEKILSSIQTSTGAPRVCS